MLNTVSKIRGQVKNPGYPQSEGLLGECMIRHGKELGDSNFGEALGRALQRGTDLSFPSAHATVLTPPSRFPPYRGRPAGCGGVHEAPG